MKLNPESSSNVCTWNYTLYTQINRVFIMIYIEPLPSYCELFIQLRTTCDEISQLGLYSVWTHQHGLYTDVLSTSILYICELFTQFKKWTFLLIKSCNDMYMYKVSLLLIFLNSSKITCNEIEPQIFKCIYFGLHSI